MDHMVCGQFTPPPHRHEDCFGYRGLLVVRGCPVSFGINVDFDFDAIEDPTLRATLIKVIRPRLQPDRDGYDSSASAYGFDVALGSGVAAALQDQLERWVESPT